MRARRVGGSSVPALSMVNPELEQLAPTAPAVLRAAKRARLTGVRGKGNITRTVFVSADGRAALADYLKAERSDDAGRTTTILFCSAISIASRRPDGGRLSTRAVNLILERIGAWHTPSKPTRTDDWANFDRSPCATLSPSPCPNRPTTTPTNSNAASGTAPSATSLATPNPPEDVAASYV